MILAARWPGWVSEEHVWIIDNSFAYPDLSVYKHEQSTSAAQRRCFCPVATRRGRKRSERAPHPRSPPTLLFALRYKSYNTDYYANPPTKEYLRATTGTFNTNVASGGPYVGGRDR